MLIEVTTFQLKLFQILPASIFYEMSLFIIGLNKTQHDLTCIMCVKTKKYFHISGWKLSCVTGVMWWNIYIFTHTQPRLATECDGGFSKKLWCFVGQVTSCSVTGSHQSTIRLHFSTQGDPGNNTGFYRVS